MTYPSPSGESRPAIRLRLSLSGRDHEVELRPTETGYEATVDGTPVHVQVEHAARAGLPEGAREDERGAHVLKVLGEGVRHEASVVRGRLLLDSEPVSFTIASVEGVAGAGSSGRHGGDVRPPMTGKLVAVHVQAGQEVAVGDVLFVLEAMKMQNEVRSPVAGRVEDVAVAAGANVEPGQVVVRIATA